MSTMNIIKTKSFELAIYMRGDANSPKLAIVIPGRLDTKDYVHNTDLVDYLASLGLLSLSFDPPGTWESPGSIELYTTTNYLKAIDELIDYFDNKPTLLLGHSRGGSVAILAADRNPQVIGLVAIMASYGPPSPPSEDAVKSGFQISHRDLPPGSSKTEEQRRFSLPINYFIDGEKYNPGQTIKGVKVPKLLIYGLKDKFTNSETVRSVYEAIPEPKEIVAIDYTHDYRRYPEAILEVDQAVGKFLRSSLVDENLDR